MTAPEETKVHEVERIEVASTQAKMKTAWDMLSAIRRRREQQ